MPPLLRMSLSILVLVSLCLFWPPQSFSRWSGAKSRASEAVVIIKVTFEDGNTSLGTGFFADHDGLIVTADHVIKGFDFPPPEDSLGPTGAKTPRFLEVYSAFLERRFQIDLANNQQVIFNPRQNKGKWLDLAALRVELNPQERSRVQPLHVAVDLPSAGQRVSSYGPKCNRPNSESCFEPVQVQGIISGEPQGSQQYEVAANMTLGYSGGPLLDDSDRVLGVCSFGKRIGLGDDVSMAFYVPAAFLLKYLRRLPASKAFEESSACAYVKQLSSVTQFDLLQISPQFTAHMNEAQCACCCECLSKTPNNSVMLAPILDDACTPPDCKDKKLRSYSGAIRLILWDGTVQSEELKPLYLTMGKVYADVMTSRGDLAVNAKAEAHRVFGAALASIATDPVLAESPEYADAGLYALRAFARAQFLVETSDTYRAMADLLFKYGQEKESSYAMLLSEWKSVHAAKDHIREWPMAPRKVSKLRTTVFSSAINAPSHQIEWISREEKKENQR